MSNALGAEKVGQTPMSFFVRLRTPQMKLMAISLTNSPLECHSEPPEHAIKLVVVRKFTDVEEVGANAFVP